MRSPVTILAASLGGLLLWQGAASAQVNAPFPGAMGPAGPFGPMVRPTLSPYLNITGFGNPAVGYYNQANFQRNQQLIDQQLLNQPAPSLEPPAPDINELIPSLPQTGHLAGFQYYTPFYGQNNPQRPYFPYNPNTGASGAGAATSRQIGPPPGTGPKRR